MTRASSSIQLKKRQASTNAWALKYTIRTGFPTSRGPGQLTQDKRDHLQLTRWVKQMAVGNKHCRELTQAILTGLKPQ